MSASAKNTSAQRHTLAPVDSASLLILISAPSGAGKTTVCQQLLAARPDMTRAVTCTTRPPRAGEVDGRDYFFLAPDDFLKRVQAGEFLEHATVYGNSYGTLKREITDKLRQGKDVLLNVDVQGAETIRKQGMQDSEIGRALVSVFLTPASVGILEQRLQKRGTDSPSVIQKRLSVAREEIGHWTTFDYLVISSSIEEDLHKMVAIIEAEKMRSVRTKAPDLSL